MAKERLMKMAQSCDSRECRSEFKSEIIKGFSEAIVTPHEINFTQGTITCLYCGKVTKLSKKKE
jgi:hypothetical protein